jgi:hypothetical protein
MDISTATRRWKEAWPTSESINYLERGQIFVLLGLAWSGVGWSHYFMNEAKTGLPYVEKGLKIHSDAGISYDLSVHYYFLGAIHSELGNIELAHIRGAGPQAGTEV